jgi:hypothetical protein
VSGSNHFDFTDSKGTWKLDGNTVPSGQARGSFYGNAEAVGGVWKMTSSGDHDNESVGEQLNATGIFQGTK